MKELLMLSISPLCPAGATAVTFMLLDLETADLLLMLEYPEILRAKVNLYINLQMQFLNIPANIYALYIKFMCSNRSLCSSVAQQYRSIS